MNPATNRVALEIAKKYDTLSGHENLRAGCVKVSFGIYLIDALAQEIVR